MGVGLGFGFVKTCSNEITVPYREIEPTVLDDRGDVLICDLLLEFSVETAFGKAGKRRSMAHGECEREAGLCE
jgi:hypothetical protein